MVTIDPNGNELLNTFEVSAVLRVSTQTVVKRIKTGIIPAIREGRKYLVKRSDLEKYIEVRRKQLNKEIKRGVGLA